MEQIFDWILIKQQGVKFLALYVIVIIAIAIDFISGWRKAKKLGIARTSYGMRHTVNKFNRYFSMLLIGSCVDSVAFLIDIWATIHIANVPYLTAAVAVFLCIIEGRSVYEKADVKYQSNIQETAKAIAKVVKNRDDAEQIVSALSEFLEHKTPTKN